MVPEGGGGLKKMVAGGGESWRKCSNWLKVGSWRVTCGGGRRKELPLLGGGAAVLGTVGAIAADVAQFSSACHFMCLASCRLLAGQ